jgi:phosphoesterase RecJ-like protein
VRELDPTECFDLTLVLDCSEARMFSIPPPRERLGQVVVIDHHRTVGDFGDVIYRDESAASVGVLLFRLFQQLELPMSQPMAEALYCSVLSDTGSFRYQNTNPEALRVGAALLESGVKPWRVASNLYETRPREQLQLLADVLQTLRVSEDGLAAALTVSEEMLTRTGCTPDMVDGFVNYARSLRGVEVAILMRPRSDAVRISLRSRGSFDVSAIAARFGGGGHRNAAGCTLGGATDCDQLLDELFADVRRLFRLGQ